MVNDIGVIRIVTALNREISLKEKKETKVLERKKNRWFEWPCIAACEVSEHGTEAYVFHSLSQESSTNLLGFVGGLGGGFLYALTHNLLDRFRHKKKISFLDTCKYALVTESGCVIATVATDATIGQLGTLTNLIQQDPLTPGNIALRVAALPLAYMIGIRAMSALTLRQKREAYRMMAQKGSLDKVEKVMRANFSSNCAVQRLKGRRLDVIGYTDIMSIEAKRLPRLERKDPANKDNLIYTVSSPTFMHTPELRPIVRQVMQQSFKEAGVTTTPLESLVAHEH